MSEYELEQCQPVEEGITSPKTLAVKYAEEFLVDYMDKFEELKSSEETTFAIPVKEWDTYIVKKRYVECVEVPMKGSAEWVKFRQDSNNIRYTLNKVAGIGMHGEPEYTISNDKNGMLLIGTTKHILAVTFGDGMASVKSLLANKDNGATKTVEHLNEIRHNLPPHIQAQISMLEPTLSTAVQTLTFVLNRYSTDVKAVLTLAESYLDSEFVQSPSDEPKAIEHQE